MISNRIGEWVGPFKLMATDESRKLVYVRDVHIGGARPFNVVQVKRYYPPETLARQLLLDVKKGMHQFSNPDADDIWIAEIPGPHDPIAESREMDMAKKKEIRKLLNRETFRVIL